MNLTGKQTARAEALVAHLHRPVASCPAVALVLRAPTRKPGYNDRVLFWRPGSLFGAPLALEVTCDPGPSTLAAPANPRGAAVLAPGVYPGMWQAGLHRGRPALRQVGPCTVDRVSPGVVVGDDSILFLSNPDTGMFGINFHNMGTPDWSAGCVGPRTQAEVDGVRVLVGDALVDVVVAAASAWNMNDLLPGGAS